MISKECLKDESLTVAMTKAIADISDDRTSILDKCAHWNESKVRAECLSKI